MDPRLLQLQYSVEHEHADGSWGELTEEESAPHDSAEHDPERAWSLRRIFRCASCGERVALTPGNGSPPPDAE
jgi:hypothetical protein